jgi:fumarylacetoacetase
MKSWLSIPEDSDFSLQNLPYGVFSTTTTEPRIGIAIGEQVLDLKALVKEHAFDDLDFDFTTLERATLNKYAGLGRQVHGKVRKRLYDLLRVDTQLGNVLRDNQNCRDACLIPMNCVTMHLPMDIGDYTDFFTGIHHARNVSRKAVTIEGPND